MISFIVFLTTISLLFNGAHSQFFDPSKLFNNLNENVNKNLNNLGNNLNNQFNSNLNNLNNQLNSNLKNLTGNWNNLGQNLNSNLNNLTGNWNNQLNSNLNNLNNQLNNNLNGLFNNFNNDKRNNSFIKPANLSSSSFLVDLLKMNNQKNFDLINFMKLAVREDEVKKVLDQSNYSETLKQNPLFKNYISKNNQIDWNRVLDDKMIQSLVKQHGPKILASVLNNKNRSSRQTFSFDPFSGFANKLFTDILNVLNQLVIKNAQTIFFQTLQLFTNSIFSGQPLSGEYLAKDFGDRLKNSLIESVPVSVSTVIEREINQILDNQIDGFRNTLKSNDLNVPSNQIFNQLDSLADNVRVQLKSILPVVSDYVIKGFKSSLNNNQNK